MAVDRHAMLHGGIAQLGERLNGIQEVRGSTPLISTSIGSGLLSVDKSSDFCLYRIRRPYFPEDLPLPIARFRLLLGNLYAKKFSDFSGNPLLFCRMCAIILALHRGIAQLVEYRSPKPWVAGSNPPAPAMLCGQNRSARGKQPFGKPNGGKTGDFERFLPFFSSLLFFEKIPIHISNNQEYRELQHRQSQNKAELLETLSDEQKELLENFCATEIEPNGISEREAFTAGFKIAMRLAAEAFYEADNE